MPISPQGSLLTFTWSVPMTSVVTAYVAVESIAYSFVQVPFKRPEFAHQRLLDAPNVDGSKPVINYLIGNRPVQYFTNCNPNETARALTPDDSVIDSVYQRFDTRRYEIVGLYSSPASQVNKIDNISKAHQVLLAQFATHQEIAASGNVSFHYLTTVSQAETFSYLTTTYLSVSGPALGAYSPENNLILTDFKPDVTHEIPSGANAGVWKVWKATLENRVIKAAEGGTW